MGRAGSQNPGAASRVLSSLILSLIATMQCVPFVTCHREDEDGRGGDEDDGGVLTTG